MGAIISFFALVIGSTLMLLYPKSLSISSIMDINSASRGILGRAFDGDATSLVEEALTKIDIEDSRLRDPIRSAIYTHWQWIKDNPFAQDDSLTSTLLRELEEEHSNAQFFGQQALWVSWPEPYLRRLVAVIGARDSRLKVARAFTRLASAFRETYRTDSNLNSLHMAVFSSRLASRLVPYTHVDKAAYLNDLRNVLDDRSLRFDHTADLDEAIKVQREAVELVQDDHPDRLLFLSNLGTAHARRYLRHDSLADLEEAIIIQRTVIGLTPEDDPAARDRLNNLGVSLGRRFDRLGSLGDVEESIAIKQRAVNLTPDDDPSKPNHLSNLGVALKSRYTRTDALLDLEDAIAIQQRAVSLAPDSHSDKHMYLNSLGNSLNRRYERFRNLPDLDSAIAAKQQAVKLAPDDHPNKPGYLNNLGISLEHRHAKLKAISDLDEAIAVHRRAVELSSEGHPSKALRLMNVGVALHKRYMKNAIPVDLEDAISAQRLAIQLTPDSHPNKPRRFTNLGLSLLSRYEKLDNSDDLEEAIVMQRQAVNLTPEDHPDASGFLSNLGGTLVRRFKKLKEPRDFEDAFHAYMKAAEQDTSAPAHRLRAAQRCARLCWENINLATYERLLDVYQCILALIPQVAWLGHGLGRRYEELSRLGDIVNAAAVVAITMGRVKLAVEWLEAGRNIVWGQVLQLRTPLDELREKHPELAERLQEISRALDSDSAGIELTITAEFAAAADPESESSSLDSITRSSALEDKAVTRRRLPEQYKQIISAIRAEPGFEQFLLPKKLSALVPSPEAGHVVIINIHDSRSDALVVYPDENVVLVPLPTELTPKFAKRMRSRLSDALERANVRSRGAIAETWGDADDVTMEWVLENLWKLVVRPILAAIAKDLSSARASNDQRVPHITWCATGPLAFLPLHAAGVYGGPEGKTKRAPRAFRYFVSSYTPTLSALSRASLAPTEPECIVIVSQADTPGISQLPGVAKEVESIKKHFSGSRLIHLDGEAATADAVLKAIDEHHPRMLHFACHGIQDREDPTQSAFLLQDGRLSLDKLMAKSMDGAELAFLSACQTATGDVKLPEEAVHLAACMLTVGYSSVISTMWSIRDEDAPLVADEVYAQLLKHGKGDEGTKKVTAAHALHRAVGRLRGEVGEKNYLRWIPFVHFGL